MRKENIYHYVESGLSNVYLHNVRELRDHKDNDVIIIPKVNLLHKAISLGIILKEGISGAELKFLRTQLGKTQSELAIIAKIDAQTIGRWEREENSMDKAGITLIKVFAINELNLDNKIVVNEFILGNSFTDAEKININYDGTNYDITKDAA